MCGILAVFNKQEKMNVQHADGALDKLKLRGPDFSYRDIDFNGRLYCGQTVLSITGQPGDMLETYHKSKSGRYNLIFNGEIYNYQELFDEVLAPKGYQNKSGSDTEVLVKLHDELKPEAIHVKLRGMFGYIIYDNEKKVLFIGRDLIGEKVLYYYEDDEFFIVASEVGPILEMKSDLKINPDILRQYFFTRHLLTPVDAAFQGIKVVRPGSLLEYDLNKKSLRTINKLELHDLIDPQKIADNKKKTKSELADELELVMTQSGQMIAPREVPFTCVVSGGLDSSLASLYVSREAKPNHFVALQFPDKDKISQNLQPFGEIIGCDIKTYVIDQKIYRDFLPQVYGAAGAPLPTHSFTSQAIVGRYVKDLGDKVWIGGHGGDEVFAGYELYKKFADYKDYPKTNPSAYSGLVPLGFEFENWDSQKLEDEIKQRWQLFSKIFEFETNPQDRMIQTALYTDMAIMLESVGIREADTMSMLSSVEPRCFYLTYLMLEFALNLPANMKVDVDAKDDAFITRPLLKEVFIRKFGKDLLFPKQGFSGYPNEAGLSFIDNDFPLVKKALRLKMAPSNDKKKMAADWKLINTEMFLEQFQKHI